MEGERKGCMMCFNIFVFHDDVDKIRSPLRF